MLINFYVVFLGLLLGCHAASIPPAASDLGCWYDKATDREFRSVAHNYYLNNLTPETCRQQCKIGNFKYAALQRGDLCLCGDSYGRHGSAAAGLCNMVCTGANGDTTMTCGGLTTVRVYTTPDSVTGLAFIPIGVVASYEPAIISTYRAAGTVLQYDFSFLDGSFDMTLTSQNITHYPQVIGKDSVKVVAMDIESKTTLAYSKYTAKSRIVGIELSCPDFWSEYYMFDCVVTLQQGSNIQASLTFQDGRVLSFTPADSQIYKYGTIAGSMIASPLTEMGTVALLVNQMIKENGTLVAVDFNANAVGSLVIQVYRPVCEGTTPYFCPRSSTCVTTEMACQTSVPRGITCGSSALYSIRRRVCIDKTTQKVIPSLTATSWASMPVQKYAYIAQEAVSITAAGNAFMPLTSNLKVRKGDMIGLYQPTAIAFTASPGNSVYEFSAPAASAPTTGFQISSGNTISAQHLVRFHVMSPSVFKVQHNYTAGLSTYNITLTASNDLPSSAATYHIIDIQQNITNLQFTCPFAAKTNSTVTLTVPPHRGSKVWYTWDFNDGNITVNQLMTLTHVFTRAGVYFINLTASNNISQDNFNCTTTVQDEVLNLQVTPGQIATYHSQNTLVSWAISQGTNVTFALDLGDGQTASIATTGQLISTTPKYTLDHSGLAGAISYLYVSKGNYSFTVNASNLVSWQMVNVYLPVQIGILSLQITNTNTLTWGIINVMDVSMSQGSDYQCHAKVDADLLNAALVNVPEATHVGTVQIPSSYYIGYHTFTIHCENLVSWDNETKTVLIEYKITNCQMSVSAYHVKVSTIVTFNLTMVNGSHYDLNVNFDNNGGTHSRYVVKTEASDIELISFQFGEAKNSTVILSAVNNISRCDLTAVIVVQNPVKDITLDMPSSIVLNKGAVASITLTLQLLSTTLPPTDAYYVYTFGDGQGKADVFTITSGGIHQTVHQYSSISTLQITLNISNLASYMSFTHQLQVDQPVEGLGVVPIPDALIVNSAAVLNVSMEWGSRFNVEWAYGDGTKENANYSTYYELMEISHVYTSVGFYYCTVTASNSLGSKQAVSRVILVQNTVRDLTLQCPPKTHLTPANAWTATVDCAIVLADGAPLPTNISAFVDFSFNANKTTPITLTGTPRTGTVSQEYTVGNKYTVWANVSNLVSFQTLTYTHDVIEQIENPSITVNYNYSGQLINPVTRGGVLYLPSDWPIRFTLTTTHGSHITTTFNWGDGTTTQVYNETLTSHNFTTSTFTININLENDVNAGSPITLKPMTFTFIRPCWNVSMFVDNPRPENTSFNFEVNAARVCTKGCYWTDLEDDAAIGDGTRYRLFGDLDQCKYSFPDYVDTGPYSSKTTFRPLDESALLAMKANGKEAIFNFLTVYKTVRLYALKLRAVNYISDYTYTFNMRVTKGWCFPPKFNLVEDNKCTALCDENGYRQTMRSKPLTLNSQPTYNCTSNGKYFVWSVYKVNEATKAETLWPVPDSCGATVEGNFTSSVTFMPRCLPYGLYRISLNVSMTFEEGIFNVSSTYERIIKTQLKSTYVETTIKFNKNITLSSLLYVEDPDVEPGNKTGFQCEWYCKRRCERFDKYDYSEPGVSRLIEQSSVKCPRRALYAAEETALANNEPIDDQEGCYALDNKGQGRMQEITACDNVTLDTFLLRANDTLDVQVVVRKDTRSVILPIAWTVTEGDPPEAIVQCKINCLEKFDPRNKGGFGAVVQNFRRGMLFDFMWKFYKQCGEDAETEEIPEEKWASLTTTGTTLDNLVIQANAFDPTNWTNLYDCLYTFKVKLWLLPVVDKNNFGIASHRFKVNRPPLYGSCVVSPNIGVAADTDFKVLLDKEFIDDDLPLKYEVSYQCPGDTGRNPMHSGNTVTRSTGNKIIPAGQTTQNVTCSVIIRAIDTIGSFSDINCSVLVMPPSQEKLKELGEPSEEKLEQLKASGDPAQVMQVAFAFLQIDYGSGSAETGSGGTGSSGTGSTGTGSTGSGGTGSTGTGSSGTELTDKEKEEQERQRQEAINKMSKTIDRLSDILATIPVTNPTQGKERAVVMSQLTSNPEALSSAAADNTLRMISSVTEVLEVNPDATVSETLDNAAPLLACVGNIITSMTMRADEVGLVKQSPTSVSSTTPSPSSQTDPQVNGQSKKVMDALSALANVLSKKIVTGDEPTSVGTKESVLLTVSKDFSRKIKQGMTVSNVSVPGVEDMVDSSSADSNGTNIPYSIQSQVTVCRNPITQDSSDLVTNTMVTTVAIIDEYDKKVNVTKAKETIEMRLVHLDSKVAETIVNVSSEMQPVLSFRILKDSALFVKMRYIPPPLDDIASEKPTTASARKKRAAEDPMAEESYETFMEAIEGNVRERRAVQAATTEAVQYVTSTGIVEVHETSAKPQEPTPQADDWCLGDPEVTFTLYFTRDQQLDDPTPDDPKDDPTPDDPTPEAHDYNCTLPRTDADIDSLINKYKKSHRWKRADFCRCCCFIPRDDMNLTKKETTFKMLVVATNQTNNATITDDIQYGAKVWTPSCQYYDEAAKSYKTDGVEIGPLSHESETQCLSVHLTSFGGGFVVPMNTINLKDSAFTKLNENPIVFATMVSIMCLYLILLIYVRKQDKTDELHAGATPLLDNNPRDKYLYELVFFTGSRKNAGTSAKVHLVISGEHGETEPRLIYDDKRVTLKRSGVDVFLMSVPQPLGSLTHLRIWHDNTGDKPSWFFERLQVTDLQTEDVSFFVCDRWLAVEEDDGMIDRVIPVAGMQELTDFNHLFWIKAKRDLTDGHIWFSVFQRPKRSRFTRVQRLTCCLTLLFSSMMASILFYKADDNIQGKQVLRLGPIEITPQQIYVGFISSMIALPVNIIIALMFRYSADFPERKKRVTPPPKKNVLVVDKHNVNQKLTNDEDTENKLQDELRYQGDYLDTGELDSRMLMTPRPGSSAPSDDAVDITALNLPEAPPKKKKCQLPWWFTIIAYILSFCVVAVTFWVTVEVAGVFGKKKAGQWLIAFAVSVVESIFLSQPIKVFLFAAFYALVIRKPDTDSDDVVINDLRKNEEWLHKHFTEEDMNNPETRKLVASYKSNLPEPPDEEYLQEARSLRFKEIMMNKVIWEIIFYFIFLWLLMMVAYSSRDNMSYLVYKNYEGMIVKGSYDKNNTGKWDLTEIRSREEFWNWTNEVLLPSLYDNTWYDGKEHASTKGFLADKTGYMVGQPRFRQVRTVAAPCHQKMKHFSTDCEQSYSMFKQDEEEYEVGWKKLNYSDPSSKPATSWLYRSWSDLNGHPYWGKYNTYSGGGFTAEFGRDITTARMKYEELRSNRWIDSKTRAVFIEFLVYNPSVNLFGVSMVVLEFQDFGSMYCNFKFHVMRLDRYVGPFMFVVLGAEILAVCFIIYFIVREFRKFRKQGKVYFKDSWNIYEVLILSLAIVTIVMYFYRLVHSHRLSNQIKKNPNKFHNLQYAVLWDEAFTYLMGFMCTFSTLKFLKLLRFNKRMAMLSATLCYAAAPMAQFLLMFMILFLAFVLAAYIIFCKDLDDFSTFTRSMETLFSAMLNKFNFDGLKEADRIFGPTILFLFTLMITLILINVFITLVCQAFSVVKDDISKQSNEYEIVDFIVERFKMVTGIGETKIKLPQRRRRRVVEYRHDDYVEEVDQAAAREQENIEKTLAKLEYLIFYQDYKVNKTSANPSEHFNDWRALQKKGLLYR